MIIFVKLPKYIVDAIDRVVAASGKYRSRSEFIRTAVLELLDRESKELRMDFFVSAGSANGNGAEDDIEILKRIEKKLDTCLELLVSLVDREGANR